VPSWFSLPGIFGKQKKRKLFLPSYFEAAHVIVRVNILNPALKLIPYKKRSRDYTPEEHLDIVCEHIRTHLKDMNKALAE
jgi:hypothetical protein